jgi:hypothetical protein
MSVLDQTATALTAHPAAADAPEPHPDVLRELQAQIASDGLICPIVLLDGQILEGRIRHQACLAIGYKPEFRQFGDAADDPVHDPAGWALEHCDRLLTPEEIAALDQAETVIERGMAAFVDVGLALAQIRDRRLYRQSHPSFDAWCVEKLDMVRRHADRVIQAAHVVELLGEGGGPTPRTESVARELTTLREHPDRLRAAWRDALEHHGPRPTAEQTRTHVEQHNPTPKKPTAQKAPKAPAAAPTSTTTAAPGAGAAAPASPGVDADSAADDAARAAGEGRSVALNATPADTTVIRQGAFAPHVPTEPVKDDQADDTIPKMRESHAVRNQDPSAQRARALVTMLRDTPPADPRDVADQLRTVGNAGAIRYIKALAGEL